MVSSDSWQTVPLAPRPMTPQDSFSEQKAVIGGVAMALLFYGILAFFFVKAGHPDVLNGRLWDGDSYMWLVRIQDLWFGGSWWDHTNARISPPEGFAQHWTRPLDFLLLAGTWIFEPFLGFESALFWVGAFMNAVILVPALFAFAWAARPLFENSWDRQWVWLVGVFFLFMPSGMTNFAVGRPDHHALVILFTTLFLGAAFRVSEAPSSQKTAILAGLFAGLALWISIQALPFIVAVIAGLGVWWVLGKKELAPSLAIVSLSTSATMLVALFLEYGSLASAGVYDTLSLPYLSAFLLCSFFWLAAAWIQKTTAVAQAPSGRIFLAGLLAAAVLGTLWLFFPGFFSNPMDSEKDLSTVLMNPHIQELKPAFYGLAEEDSFFRAIGTVIRKGALAILSVPILAYGCLKSHDSKRPMWGILLALTLLYVPLAFFQIRWNGQANAILVFPYAVLVICLLRELSNQQPLTRFLPILRPLAIVFFCTWSYLPLIAANILVPKATGENGLASATSGEDRSCNYRKAFPLLNDTASLGATPKNIVMGINDTAIVLYETPHRVYAIANHRMSEGFRRLHEIFSAEDDRKALAALREARADLILSCKYAPDVIIHKGSDDKPGFHERLAEGSVPDFLEPIDLPDGAENLLFFRVLPGEFTD